MPANSRWDLIRRLRVNCDVVAVEVEGPVGDKRGAMEA